MHSSPLAMLSHLLLQKQITLDDEPEQFLHAVVVGSQWDALFLEEREFVVGQAAADSITGGVLQEIDGGLSDSIVRRNSAGLTTRMPR